MQREIIKLKQEAVRPDLEQRSEALKNDLIRLQDQLSASQNLLEERERTLARV